MSHGSPLLPAGSRVAVVAPAGVFDPARLRVGMDLLRAWGLEPVPAPNLDRRHRYTAGTHEERRADLRWALGSDEVQGAWFARGGYGTVHLLPEALAALRDERPIIGFSDATALFCALQGQGRGGRVHGPVLHSLGDLVDEDSRGALRGLLLEGRRAELPGRWLLGPPGAVEGPLLGGNLCVLASLCGTPWAMRARGAIVLLEDIGEPPYKVDRMLTQLRLAGCLEGAVGIALGTFTGCEPPAGADWTLEQVLADLLAPLGLPVVAGLPVGHGAANRAWLHGRRVRLHEGGLHPLEDARA